MSRSGTSSGSPPWEPLEASRIRACLGPGPWPPVEVLDEVDSTNAELRRRRERGRTPPLALLAEHQWAGRGRGGRRWEGARGRDIALSLWLPASSGLDTGRGAAVSLAAGVAAARALAGLGVSGVGLKWPNDVLAGDRKICGILCEALWRGPSRGELVVGIGLNVATDPARDGRVGQPTTDLERELGARPERNRVAAALVRELWSALSPHGADSLDELLGEWQGLDVLRGAEIELREGEATRQGVALGIAPDGALRVATAQGELRVHTGEVSVRRRPLPAGLTGPEASRGEGRP